MQKLGLTLTLWMLVLFAAAGCDTPSSTPTDQQSADAQTSLLPPSIPATLAPPLYTTTPTTGRYLFLIDRSLDSGTIDSGQVQTRLERSIRHVRQQLSQFTFNASHEDYFDIMSFGGAPTTYRLFGTLVPATSANLAFADQHLSRLQPAGPSPQYTALRDAMLGSPTDLSRLYFYAASNPGSDPNAPGGQATFANILADVPGWWTGFVDATLMTIRVGGATDPLAAYLQNLAALTGGVYIDL